MKRRLLPFFILLCVCTCISAQDYYQSSYTVIPTFSDSELQTRIQSLNNQVIPSRFDRTVKSYINTYSVKRRQSTERMLGLMDVYFPMFEKHLLERDMPTDLKYLSIVESALNPRAKSRSGAMGLWQFMPATGREYGLKINSLVDERKDPTKSTEAALKYLSRLYKKYGDWSLVLAAYNGGPGRVNRAIKRGRSKNFWRIRKYLPSETRAYVPAFIAAYYIVNFHHQHNLLPLYPDAELKGVETTKIYQRINFQTISEVTGTPMQLIEDLNPSYKQRFLFTNSRGNYLRLPPHRMATLLNYLGRPDERLNRIVAQQIFKPEFALYNENFNRTTYVIQGNESLTQLAEKFNCSPENIKDWNKLRSDRLQRGQQIMLYVPKISAVDLLTVPLPETKLYAQPMNAPQLELPVRKSKIRSISRQYRLPNLGKNNKYIYHQIRRRESLTDIAEKYKVGLQSILQLNGIKEGQQLKPGKRIIVKEK